MVGGLQDWAAITRATNLASFERIGSVFPIQGPFPVPGIHSIAALGQNIVALSSGFGDPIVSTNAGQSFRFVTRPEGSGGLSSVEAAQDKFVGVGTGGTILRSTDGLTWSRRLSNTTRDLYDVVFGNGTWVAVGDGGLILTSPDASFFTLGSSGTEVPLRGVTYGNGLFVAVGNSGAILRSTNGVNWTIFGTEEARDLHAVTFDSGRFVAVGTNGAVHVSTNGLTWTSTQIADAPWLSDVAGANGVLLAVRGGIFASERSNIGFVSTNGLSWFPVAFLQPLYGTDATAGALWAGGHSTYITRAQAVSAEPATNAVATINENGQFNVTFTAPVRGTYTVLSSPDLAGPWQTTATLRNIEGRFTWTDTNALTRARFYRVLQNQ